MKRLMAATAGILALAGCTTMHGGDSGASGTAALPESITYETGPCFGTCPVYSLTVTADGDGTFVGKRHTAVTGEADFTVTPDQYAAFASALAPYRPDGEALYRPGEPLCPVAATDMPSIDVKWADAEQQAHLYYYFGCRMDDRSMGDALGNAVDALPVDKLIGARP